MHQSQGNDSVTAKEGAQLETLYAVREETQHIPLSQSSPFKLFAEPRETDKGLIPFLPGQPGPPFDLLFSVPNLPNFPRTHRKFYATQKQKCYGSRNELKHQEAPHFTTTRKFQRTVPGKAGTKLPRYFSQARGKGKPCRERMVCIFTLRAIESACSRVLAVGCCSARIAPRPRELVRFCCSWGSCLTIRSLQQDTAPWTGGLS